MANMAPVGTQPTSGAEIVAEPITDTQNNIINTYNGNNADENNVDYSSADGVMVLAQVQTRTANLTMSNANLSFSGTAILDMQGLADAIVLDADGDTTISAPTDDQIDISVAGADDFTITANSFNVLASSAIDMADDTQLKFGASDDYWFTYDSANTQFELNSTDVDGGGSDGVVFYIADGTDDVVFSGDITATSIAGTLTTAAQTNITSVGTLTSLTLSGTLNVGDNNITNVGDIALDSISPDSGSAITVNAVPTFTSAGFPNFYVHRDTNTATSGLEVVLQFDNSSNAVADYASIRAELVGNTAGSENGFLALKTARSGTLTESMRADHLGNVIINTAEIATNATDGFLYIPTCAGSPSGTPTSYTGRAPMVLDRTNNRLYLYDGGWIYAALT